MCNCKSKKGFNLVMSKAVAFESKTSREAAVFVKNDRVSFTERSHINKVEGICCYFTTDNVEHQIEKPKKRQRKKIKDIKVIVEEEE